MFDDRKATGNPGRITCCGAQGESQQQFPDEAPNNHAHVLRFKSLGTQKLVEVYLNAVSIEDFVTGSAQPKLNQQALNSIPVPMPHDIATQHQIVGELESEQALVEANRELIDRFEKKIQDILAPHLGRR